MRKLLKFLHTLGGVGLLGAMAALLVLLSSVVEPSASLDIYVAQRDAMANIAQWLLLPSLAITLVSGLFSMAVVKGFHNAGWAWLKLATGILMFEGTLLSIQGPMEREAALAKAVFAGDEAVSALAANPTGEWGSLWVLGGVAVLNIALGVWRPKFGRWFKKS